MGLPLPDNADDVMVSVPLRKYLALVQAAERAGPEVDTNTAAEILDVEPRVARRMATRWYRQQQDGRTPAVRVSRTSDADHAHWRFDEHDLRAYAGKQNHVAPPPESDDNVRAIAARMIRNGTR